MPIATTTKEKYSASADQYTGKFSEYIEQFRSLREDDQLATLYAIFGGLGDERIENPDNNEETDSSLDFYNEIVSRSHDEQLQFMRDVLSGKDNDLTGQYNQLSNTTKVALWYRLGQGMEENVIVDVPAGYSLSDEAKEIVSAMNANSFEQSYIFMRDVLLG